MDSSISGYIRILVNQAEEGYRSSRLLPAFVMSILTNTGASNCVFPCTVLVVAPDFAVSKCRCWGSVGDESKVSDSGKR